MLQVLGGHGAGIVLQKRLKLKLGVLRGFFEDFGYWGGLGGWESGMKK